MVFTKYAIALLPLIFLIVNAKRGRRINLYHQKGGDILQLKPQASIWGRMRNALPTNSLNRWTEYRDNAKNYVLPYVVSGNFDPEERAIIFGAMGSIERNTCLRFKKRTDERDFVDLRNEADEGCYTSVGRNKGRNIVMLEANNRATCVEHDIVVHELFHTIGLWHEQMRSDRDDHINIRYDRIDPAFFSQFEKISTLESTTYNVEYDYLSVMHYAKDAFSAIPGEITMETKNKDYQDVIGKVMDASPSDYIKVCSIYKCGICMGKPFGKKFGNIPLPLTSPPPSFAQRFTTQKRPRSTHEPQKSPKSECEDSFFCSRMFSNAANQAVCSMGRVRRWCCASCQ